MKDLRKKMGAVCATTSIYVLIIFLSQKTHFYTLPHLSFPIILFLLSVFLNLVFTIFSIFYSLNNVGRKIPLSVISSNLLIIFSCLYLLNILNHFILFCLCISLIFVFYLIYNKKKIIILPLILFFILYIYTDFNNLDILSITTFVLLSFIFLLIIFLFHNEIKDNRKIIDKKRLLFSDFKNVSSGVFHDLINYLNTIYLALNTDNRKNPNFKISTIYESTEKAMSTAKRMSTFLVNYNDTYIQSKNINNFNVKKSIESILNSFKIFFDQFKISIYLDINSKNKINGNIFLFERVLSSIISNAIDAVKNSKNKNIFITFKKEKNNFILSVKDSGCGICKTKLDQVFNPLFTLKKDGNGIGLYVTKNIIENHFSGSISIESKLGLGTKVLIYFPNN